MQKTKDFFQIFFSIFRICIKFRTFSKKEDVHRLYKSQITDHEKPARKMSKSSSLGESVDRRHGKWAEALIQY